MQGQLTRVRVIRSLVTISSLGFTSAHQIGRAQLVAGLLVAKLTGLISF